MTHPEGIKLSEFASALGISAGRLSQLRAKGMPCDSLAEAEAWRKTNCQNWRVNDATRRKGKRKAPVAPPTDSELDAAAAVPELGSIEEIELFLRELRASISWASSNARTLWDSGDQDSSRRWATLHALLRAKFPPILAQLTKTREVLKQTILVGDARAVFSAVLVKLRSMLDVMPANLAPRCNPSDPVLAQTMLEDWRGQCLRAIHGTPI